MPSSGASRTFGSVLVTGASGFVGQHLLPALANTWPQATLHATHHGKAPDPGVASCGWHPVDIRDSHAVSALIRRLQPDAIVHLAAQSHVPTSFQHPQQTWQVNLNGTLNLLEGVRRESPHSLVLNVGSSDMYGATFRSGRPVSELSALLPLNPYAASKAAADLAAWQYAASEGLSVVRARPFNHTGPGQSDGFVLAAFASQIARIEAGRQPPVVETGNLDAQRDFLDVADVVDAYLALLQMPPDKQCGQAYNIASGRPVAIEDLLECLLGKASTPVSHRLDPARQRPSDIQRVQADISALHAATSWQPRIGHDQMLQRLLDDCRQRQALA